ncbi:DUF4235 domain-containing protein [Nocardioides sp.]|uniref:DUF4235 domain-containing protein n=1 Tax=Nocardioides sp. TaxID=35761 RepID=UPI002B2677F8|nr:DUF4235 domain-containing protein [Nocardioides sp.]
MTRSREKPTSTSAKILYKPVGIVSGMVAGAIAGQIFQQVWGRTTHGSDDPPKPLESEYPIREVVVAAAVQGAIYAIVKAVVTRGGARLFERSTGEWPGD